MRVLEYYKGMGVVHGADCAVCGPAESPPRAHKRSVKRFVGYGVLFIVFLVLSSLWAFIWLLEHWGVS